jgi:predicted metal-dependent phosphoesterase TrpH
MIANPLLDNASRSEAQDSLALKQVFQLIHAESCPHVYNFHMHTIASDGKLKPEDLAQQAIKLGLKGFAITDHHSVEGYKVAQQYFAQQSETTADSLPHLWTGLEVTAELLDTEVHILSYAFDPHHPDLQIYLQGCAPSGATAQAAQVIAAIHEAGGLAVLAHPVRYKRSAQDLIPEAYLAGVDGVEVFYAYNNPHPWSPSPVQTKIVMELATTYGLLRTCGTDTHGLSLLQRL